MDVTVYYLEMLAHAQRPNPAPRDDLLVLRAENPPVGYYRYLYGAVGQAYHWHSRGKLPDDILSAVIRHPLDEIWVLHVAGVPAGFAELDCRQSDDIELVQFGLTADFIGQGLGTWFLQWTVDKAWSYAPRRYWLHTCTLDHPRALPNYKRAGFVVFKEEVIQRDVRCA